MGSHNVCADAALELVTAVLVLVARDFVLANCRVDVLGVPLDW
jgi:hypothetical protein